MREGGLVIQGGAWGAGTGAGRVSAGGGGGR